MGWVTRGSKSYYYKSRRVGGRVETEFFSGLYAQLAAAADEEERAERQREASILAEDDSLDRQIAEAFDAVEDLARQELEQAGFYRHKRQWRRRGPAKA